MSAPDADMRTYLGDGVYAKFDGFKIWVWTSDGRRESERIALDPNTSSALVRYMDQVFKPTTPEDQS